MNRNVTATILIVLSLGIYLTYTKTKVEEVKAELAVNKEYTTAIENAARLIKVRDEVLKQYRNLSEEERVKLDKMIPNTVDNIRLVIDLTELARNEYGFALRNIKAAAAPSQKNSAPTPVARPPGSTIPTPTLDTVIVSFNATADYNRFIDFLRALESNLRIMDLTRLTVTVNQNGTYDFGVEFKTYWLRTQ